MNDVVTESLIAGQKTRDIVVEIVSATRLSEEEFWERSALGQSLACFAHDPCFATRISFENKRGLPELYNESIRASAAHDILVFVHDDVWLNDYFLVDRLVESFHAFDVIGVAGNRRRSPRQTAWFSAGNDLTPDFGNLSGLVGHGQGPLEGAKYFGYAPAACELLDGVFLAAKKSTLVKSNVLFDPRFRFHFYDMDFCRTARQNNLKLGTSRINLTHQSVGDFTSPGWREGSAAYLAKWGN
ncbi:MAG: glycosyltransferase [Betaproteobacteria bacterium]